MSDKTTVVSLFPIEINEHKPGVYPGHFKILAAKDNDFEILHVGNSIYWVNFHDGRPPLKVEETADKVGASVVNDFIRNIFGASMDLDAYPGLFWVEGHLKKEEILKNHSDKIANAKASQFRWYNNLVKLADDAWTASNKQHRVISSIQRLGCAALGLERDWMLERVSSTGPKYCSACKTRVHDEAVVCSNCRFILDEARYKLMKFASGV